MNSSPIMTVKAAVSTQLPELLALIALWPEAGSPGVFREVVGAAIHRSVKAVFIDKILFCHRINDGSMPAHAKNFLKKFFQDFFSLLYGLECPERTCPLSIL